MRRVFVAALAAVGLLVTAWAEASEVRILRLQSREALLEGTFEGVSIDELGTLALGPSAERAASLSEPFVLSAAAHPDGWVIGTGNAGKVLLVRRDGEVVELFEATEPEVFAVWVDGDGTVFAGTSPDGKVYRLTDEGSEVLVDPDATYIWDLEGRDDGGLLVATGTEGRLLEVTASGEVETVWDSDDTHIRAVHVLDDGGIVAGTAGEGLVVRIDDGRVRALYDAPQPEVVTFAESPAGEVYAAVVASESSRVELGRSGGDTKSGSDAETGNGGDGDDDEGEDDAAVVVIVDEEDDDARPMGSRPPGFEGVRSEIVRVGPGGDIEPVARFDDQTIHSLLWHGDRLWVGTGLEGKVFSVVGDERVLETDVEERQVVALLPDGEVPALATTNAAALYRLTADDRRRGTYTSPSLDAGGVARFGVFRWRGTTERKGSMRFAFRSGIVETPDRTWSAWTDWRRGETIDVGDLPSARYVQWRVEMAGPGRGSPSLSSTELSFLQQNLAPRITELEVLDAGEILVSYKFNPADQVFEPSHPSKDRIFTTLEPTGSAAGQERLKKLWKHGYRTLRWKAKDPNDDDLRYRLSFRPENPGGVWHPIVEELESNHFSFDATVLPDGVYRFRLEARDRSSSEGDEGLVATKVSEPVVVDQTPPRVVDHERSGQTMTVEVFDTANPLREATYSVDAGAWRPATVVDGLLDGRRERLQIELPAEARLLILRLTDAAHNSRTVSLLEEPSREG